MPSATSLLRRRSSGSSVASRTPILPPRDVPKSFLSRDMISSAVARNRAIFLQEQQQREMLKSEALKSDVLARQQMLLDDLKRETSIEEQQKQTLLAMERTNPLAIMEAATRVAQQHQHQLSTSSTTPPALRLPLSPRSSALSPGLNNDHERYVAAIDAAFASETGNGTNHSGVRPSLSLLASALANHKNQHHRLPQTFENPLHGKSLMGGSTALSGLDDHRMLLASAKSMYPPRFEDNEVHKMLRAKYG